MLTSCVPCVLQVQRYLEAAMGPAEVAVMQAALAVPPLHTCLRVNTLRTTPQVCRVCVRGVVMQGSPLTQGLDCCFGAIQHTNEHVHYGA